MKIIEDFKAFVDGRGIGKAITVLCFNPCFHSVFLFRLASFFYKIHLSVISKIIWYINRLIYHVDIDYRADLAGGFVLIHGLGVVIGRSVSSKGRLTVYQGVTIGGNNGKIRIGDGGKEYYQPIIGENVKIYTNASVFGPILIRENTVINAGRIVSQDI